MLNSKLTSNKKVQSRTLPTGKNLKLIPFLFLLVIFLFCEKQAQSQTIPPPPDWNSMMSKPNANFYTIKTEVENYFNTYPEKKEYEVEEDEDEGGELSYQNYLRWDYYWRYRVDDGTNENHGSF